MKNILEIEAILIDEVEKKPFLEVNAEVAKLLDCTPMRLQRALSTLRVKGYPVWYIHKDDEKRIVARVLCQPETTFHTLHQNKHRIQKPEVVVEGETDG